MIKNLNFLLFFSVYIYFGVVTLLKLNGDNPKLIGFKKCETGYIGHDCEISTCLGYDLCKNGTFCSIINNKHACFCFFFDTKGLYQEIKNCNRKFLIKNGVCFLLKTGKKICNCNKDWIGKNCDKRKVIDSYLSKKVNIFEQNQNKYTKLKYHCVFKDKNDTIVDTDCYNQYEIPHGICYIIRGRIHPVCSCEEGWWGLEFDCDGKKCNKYNRCKHDGQCYFKNSKYYCSCKNGFYGDYCEKKCNISCGFGKILVNNHKNSCECLCNREYLRPDCKLFKSKTKKPEISKVKIHLYKTNFKNSTNSVVSSPKKILFKKSDYINNPNTIQQRRNSKPKTNSKNSSKTKSNNIIATTDKFINHDGVNIANILKENKKNFMNNSFFESNKRLEYISIGIIIAFAFLAINLIYHKRDFTNQNNVNKLETISMSNK